MSIKLLKLKYGRGDQIIQTLWKIGSPKKWGLPSLICRNFKSLTKKIFWIIQSTWKSNKWRRIWVLESFKIEIQKGDQIIQLFFRSAWFLPRNQAPSIQGIQLFYRIGFPHHPWKLGPILNLRQFQKTVEK